MFINKKTFHLVSHSMKQSFMSKGAPHSNLAPKEIVSCFRKPESLSNEIGNGLELLCYFHIDNIKRIQLF